MQHQQMMVRAAAAQIDDLADAVGDLQIPGVGKEFFGGRHIGQADVDTAQGFDKAESHGGSSSGRRRKRWALARSSRSRVVVSKPAASMAATG